MSSENKEHSLLIAKGASVIFFGILIGNIVAILYQFLLGRFLGPEDYGLYNLGISIVVIFAVFPHFGLGSALTQFIPYNLKIRKHDKVNQGVNFSLSFCFIVGLIVAIFLFVFSGYIALEIFHNNNLEYVLQLLSLALIFWPLHNTAQVLMQAFKKPKYFVLVEYISMPVIQVLIFLLFILMGYMLFGAIIAFISSAIFACVAYLVIYRTKLIKYLNFREFKKVTVRKELLSLSWPLFLAGSSILVMGYADKILLGIFINPTEVGIYSAALTLATMVLFIYTSFSYNFMPLAAENFAIKEFDKIKNLFSSTTKWIFLITLPVILYIVFFSKDVINLVYGQSYLSGSIVFLILSIGYAMNGFTGLTGEILIAIKKPRLNLVSEIIGAISNLILNIILIPKIGILGAAIGTSTSILLKNISSLTFVYKEVHFHPYNSVFLKIFLIASLSMVSVTFIVSYLNSFLNFLIVIPFYFIIYFLILLFTNCFDETDKFIIKNSLKKVRLYDVLKKIK